MALSKFVVTQDMFIGSGSYGMVYKLPDNMCVKVFYGDNKQEQEASLLAEIEGSDQMDAVPILDIVEVVVIGGGDAGVGCNCTSCRERRAREPAGPKRTYLGVVKPFIPLPVTDEAFEEWKDVLRACNPKLKWDIKHANIRMDHDGNLWLVDTSINTLF